MGQKSRNQKRKKMENHLEDKTAFFNPKEKRQPEAFFTPSGVQPKLEVGKTGDKQEQQAEQMAQKITESNVQRQGEEEEVQAKKDIMKQEEEEVQAKTELRKQEEEEEVQAKKEEIQKQEEEEVQAKEEIQKQEEEEVQAKEVR